MCPEVEHSSVRDASDRHDVTWVGARMSKDRKSLTFYADVDIFCGGKDAGVYLTTTDAKLGSGGRPWGPRRYRGWQ